MMSHGHEHWHPNAAFYYERGGGPMYDMGPYYLTALVSLLGPVRRITGATGSAFEERTILSEPNSGQRVTVEVPTHVAGLLDFQGRAVATIVTSFDVWASRLPRIEIYGTEGTLSVPDPNTFGGPIEVQRGRDEWESVGLAYPEGRRGLGVADMASAIRSGRPSRVDSRLARHVLEIMQRLHESSDTDRHVVLRSTCDQPAPVPAGLSEGVFE
jgi:predicted dehydrogenase